MNVSDYAQKICGTLEQVFSTTNDIESKRLVDEIRKANRIFMLGKGRSGIVMRMFAMRLMHLGLTAYVVDETVTPSIGKNDLLLIGSGSGKTGTCAFLARLAKDAGASIGLITAISESLISQLSDFTVELPVWSVVSNSEQFGGSYFEQALLIYLDAVIAVLRECCEVGYEMMQSRHSNLE